MDSVTGRTEEGTGIDGALRLDVGMVREPLDEVVRGTVEDAQRAPGRRGGPGLQRRAVRAVGRPAAPAGRKLFPQAADEDRGGGVEGPPAAEAAPGDGDHRALRAAGEQRGGDADGDVPSGGERAARGGHHRGVVGGRG